MKKELERKFSLLRFPEQEIQKNELQILSVVEIEQTYVAVGADDELRIRKLTNTKTGDETYTYAFKKGKGEQRLEQEEQVSKEFYQYLMASIQKKPLKKKRTTLTNGMVHFEIDHYADYPFSVVEVEFETVEAMQQFTPPGWCTIDISHDPMYKNIILWKNIQ